MSTEMFKTSKFSQWTHFGGTYVTLTGPVSSVDAVAIFARARFTVRAPVAGHTRLAIYGSKKTETAKLKPRNEKYKEK